VGVSGIIDVERIHRFRDVDFDITPLISGAKTPHLNFVPLVSLTTPFVAIAGDLSGEELIFKRGLGGFPKQGSHERSQWRKIYVYGCGRTSAKLVSSSLLKARTLSVNSYALFIGLWRLDRLSMDLGTHIVLTYLPETGTLMRYC
jgi:hypothetical protein